MKFFSTLRRIIISWDFWGAVFTALLVLVLAPQKILVVFAKDVLSVSISVLAIIFSVFFAALAVLITAGDNEFVRFLEEDGSYSQIVWTFKVTLILLFTALLASIILYIVVLPYAALSSGYFVPKWLVTIYLFLSSYALFATGISALDAVKYAEFRARFLEIIRKNHED